MSQDCHSPETDVSLSCSLETPFPRNRKRLVALSLRFAVTNVSAWDDAFGEVQQYSFGSLLKSLFPMQSHRIGNPSSHILWGFDRWRSNSVHIEDRSVGAYFSLEGLRKVSSPVVNGFQSSVEEPEHGWLEHEL